MAEPPSTVEPARPQDFIRDIVANDLKEGRHGRRVNTRFPPEPNGYLHIGHAKSICLNFGVAEEFGGLCNLRFDDTNPAKEDVEYVDSIQEDVRWLGFDWADRMFYASDYFEQMYRYAEQLIRDGKAYVDSLTADQIREYRGSLTSPGRNSPYRDRSVEENLDLFRRMRAAEFPDGAHVLRAKIDMASPNMNMRDPTLYRIRHADASPHARYLVHLSDLRLRASDLGCHRRHHAFALHAGVRGSSAALRLGRGQPGARRRVPFTTAADRVRATESELHRDEQAEAARAGRAGPRPRLERSADADDRRASPPRLHAGSRPRFLHPHRRREEGERRRRRAPRTHRSRGSQPAGAAGARGSPPAEGRDRELPRRSGRVRRGGQQPGGRQAQALGRFRSRGCSTSKPTTS